MAENRKRILELLAEKKITVEEAEKLLALIGNEESTGEQPPEQPPERKQAAKYFRVVVQPDPEGEPGHRAERVNIRVPINLIRAGMKFTSLMPSEVADKVNAAMKEKGIDFDMRNLKTDDLQELIGAISDLEVDIDSGREKVHVYVE